MDGEAVGDKREQEAEWMRLVVQRRERETEEDNEMSEAAEGRRKGERRS